MLTETEIQTIDTVKDRFHWEKAKPTPLKIRPAVILKLLSNKKDGEC